MKTARTSLAELHWPLVAVVLLIAGLGMYNLHSAAAAHQPTLYVTQLYWFLIGLGLAAALLVPDYRVTEGLAYLFYAVVCLLLLAVLVQGTTAGGARRWLRVGGMTVQPSEIAKIATVLCLARYFSQRLRPGGYSMSALFRPLNPSRPLAVITVLVWKWNKPWLADPTGEIARGIRRKLQGAIPTIGDLIWFRIFLITLILVGCAGCILWILRAERERALLDPWPAGRSRRLVKLCTGLFVALLLGLFAAWELPVIRDPFGYAIATLNEAAAPGGPYASLQPGLALRLFLLGAACLYLAASALAVRRHADRTEDVIVAPIDLLAVPGLLVLVEPDLGTAGIIIIVGMTMILVVGVRLRSLLILGVMGAMVAVVAWFGVLKDYQKRRILTFIDPEHDLRGAGWNAVQSMIAVGSGRWMGKGHLEGTQSQLSFLPEQHTDFAFSVWGEEQGFVGCLVVLLLYALLLAFAIAVAAEARDTYGALLATGVAAIIFWQTLINVGMVIGILPVVGLTLPLFSYGGSSVLTVMIGLGLLVNVHWRRRAH